jgi:asparagine synthase (glutamine-hydrolysing)
MCGIAGVLTFDGTAVEPGRLERMIRSAAHRGPDATGFLRDGPAGLGHARLSIIDLSGGGQPMANADRSIWITFNGEIFNYVELREALTRRGRRFATRSDTEVILHLYEEYGEDCVRHLNGQWAFAIWDARARRLFLSRDRVGVRPLFFTRTADALVFASEVKALFASGAVSREIDPVGLDQVFTFWTTIAPRTVFSGVSELPPGHSALVDEGGRVAVRPHWQPRYPAAGREAPLTAAAEAECAERLLELLVDATRIRLRSDVPVGAYLSGGLDSSVITALIRRFTETPLRTFSVTFDDGEFDESRYQREVIDFLGTEHQEVRCTPGDIGRVFPQVVWHAEKPVLRTAPAPLYLLSRLVRESGFKVVLTGEGCDEMLGGYDIFKEAKIRRFWAAQPTSRLRPLLLRRLYPYLRNVQGQPDAYLRGFFHIDPAQMASPFASHLPRWDLTAKLKILFSRDLKARLAGADAYGDLEARLPADYARWDPFCQAQFLETAYLLPGYILASQGDRMAMAHSVEGRFPFLDYRVVEFAASLPPRLKMKGLTEKYLLKRIARDLVPQTVVARPKQPYRAPEGKSFFPDGAGRPALMYVEDLLSPQALGRCCLFEPSAVAKLVEKARTGRAIGIRDNMALVGVLSTQLLVHQFVEHFNVEPTGAAA